MTVFVKNHPVDLFIRMRIITKSIIPLERVEMMIAAELRNDPVEEFVAAGMADLANIRNVIPFRFRRVRENLIRSAGFFGRTHAAGVAEKLPQNYFSALWKCRVMA